MDRIANDCGFDDGVKSAGMIAPPAVAETAQRFVEDIKKCLSAAK